MSQPREPENGEVVKPLKADLFGRVLRVDSSDGVKVVRETSSARWWVRWLARLLADREARALRAVGVVDGFPALLFWDGSRLERSWIEGRPLQDARRQDPEFYAALRRHLVRLHRLGVTHNDLAKQPNVLERPDGRPALVDFQLARHHPRRGRWFRLCGREDLRHVLKHKRRYCAGALTPRELKMLAKRSLPARVWRVTGKPLYMFWTRKILRWSDREGAGDRGEVT